MGQYTSETLKKSLSICEDISKSFQTAFLSLLEQYAKEKRTLTPKIREYLTEKHLDLANFVLSHGQSAQEILEDFELDFTLPSDQILLTFQLPKPIAEYWWKGGQNSWGSLGKDVEGSSIEWGHFYRELMPIVWEKQGYYENEEALLFERINDIGEHDPKKFYYVWAMTHRESEL